MLSNIRLSMFLLTVSSLVVIIVMAKFFESTLFHQPIFEGRTVYVNDHREIVYPDWLLPRRQTIPGSFENSRAETRDLTSAATSSSWRVLTSEIVVGRPFNVILTSRDWQGNVKREGGDYYRAVLYGNAGNDTDPKPLSTLGEVTDLLNGSYLITFVPAWSGRADIRVELWLASNTVTSVKSAVKPNYIFLCVFNDDYGIRADYLGPHSRQSVMQILEDEHEYEDGRASGLALVCYMSWYGIRYGDVSNKKSSCRMKFPASYKQRWHGTCVGPRSLGLSGNCGSLKWCVYHNSMAGSNARQKYIASLETGPVYGDVDSVTVSEAVYDYWTTFGSRACRPRAVVRAQGYWFGTEWINSQCSFYCNSKKEWWRCLSNRELYFIGDSTIRQLHFLLLSSLGIAIPKSQYVPEELENMYLEYYNATIRFRMHGPPLLTSMTINFNLATFSADVIDQIPGNGNEILVLSCVHHFISMSPKGFEMRLQQIIDAIRRLKKRRMGRAIPIVVRTANFREFDSLRVNCYRVKWYNEILARAFVNANLGVVVYDVFDMTAAGRYPHLVHQPKYVMSAEMSHILSLVCYKRFRHR
ncbi:NXPE family member 3-like [Corticium candelabrum]|uniref:NXPE family member 3-like n=1 Tax=Corticium candelabrum TaxID=121492 RepID=UPI002E261E7D|nr:NXPE family member 3-like [Corticium candelabrum]XP_062521409.1 NXPE family member 3-like [Corticium candelabrum]